MRFDDCLRVVLQLEGGFTDNPADHGGQTDFGVTQGSYDAWRSGHGLVPQPIGLITYNEVQSIYRTTWDHLRCSELPPPLDLLVFDTAVNQGASFAGLCLQTALGVPILDGAIGPATLAAARSVDPMLTAGKFAIRRLTRYVVTSQSPGQDVFLHGWLHRVAAILRLV